MKNTEKFSILVIFLLICSYYCMKVIPERAAVTYINKKYFGNVTANVRRYGRRAEYVTNIEAVSKLQFGSNVTIDVIFYEYLHNEYRRSLVDLHYKLCDLILKDDYLGFILRRAGLNECPIPPGKISLTNLTLNVDIPSVWPFEKGMGELIVTDNVTGDVMGKLELILIFKQKLPKLKR